MNTTIIGRRMTCNKCGKKVWIPRSLWDLKLTSCICKQCFDKEWENPFGTNPKKYLTDEGEIAVTGFKAVVQEKEMGVVCEKCNCSHVMSPLIFIDCTFRYYDGRHQKYEHGFIVPPKKYWCPLTG